MVFMFPISRGRFPFRKFEDKLRYKIPPRLHSDEGIWEANVLESRKSCCSAVRFPKQLGTGPESSFELKNKEPKFA